MVKLMGKEPLNGTMVQNMMENLKIIKSMAMESIIIQIKVCNIFIKIQRPMVKK